MDDDGVHDNFAYAGGEIFFLTNFIMYNGKHETNVMINTFHKNSNDQIKSQSVNIKERKKRKNEKESISIKR